MPRLLAALLIIITMIPFTGCSTTSTNARATVALESHENASGTSRTDEDQNIEDAVYFLDDAEVPEQKTATYFDPPEIPEAVEKTLVGAAAVPLFLGLMFLHVMAESGGSIAVGD